MPIHHCLHLLTRLRPRAATLVAATLASLLSPPLVHAQTGSEAQPPAIAARLQATRLEWTSTAPHGRAVLRIAREGDAPQDLVLSGPLVLSLQDHPLPDGRYTYELTLAPTTAAVRPDDATPVAANPVGASSAAGPRGAMLAGNVSVAGGAFVLPPALLPPGEGDTADGPAAQSAPSSKAARTLRLTTKDQLVADDQIVQGSICMGFDCVNNESFGFDTLRLKENNLRIKFEDTSAGAFPGNDWQIIANDSASGGASYLGIDDVTGSLTPVRWLAGAPANSLVVDPQGRVGVGTGVPVLDLHVLSSNTPALRQEQNNTGGYTAQTWDVAGNEANFFVRDVTGGSLLPLRIRPGAPHASVDIAGNGSVGLGTPRPAAPLHLRRADGSGALLVDNTSATALPRVQMELQNNGAIAARLAHGTGTAYWTQHATASAFSLAPSGSGNNALSMQAGGGLVVAGTLSQGSSRTLKHDISPAPIHAVLGEVLNLPLYAWRYLSDLNASLHLGPMAEDVHQRFQVGASPRTLAPSDVAGLAAATVQALHQKLAAKDAELMALAERLSALEQQLARKNGGAR